MMNASSIRRGAATAALAVAAIGLAASPASAAVIDTDPVKIAVPFGKADFGSRDGHFLGAPVGPGTLSWDHGSTITARLVGRVYWDDFTSGGCARVQMRLYTDEGSKVSSLNSKPACRAGGGDVVGRNVDITASHAHAHRVRISTQQAPSQAGPWTPVAHEYRYFGQPGGLD